MTITAYPNGVSSFGGVVGPPNYAGWWGTNVWFVDDDAGSDGNSGKDPAKAFKTIQKAIDLAGQQDTIFLKPRDISLTAHSSHGYYTGTNIIPTSQQGLAIIGTGRGGRGIGANVQCAVEPDSGSTDATFTVRSPGVSFENMMIKCVTDAGGAIAANVNTAQAYGLTVSNCFFKDFKTTGEAVGTISLYTIHWATIQHCIFREASQAIDVNSAYASVEGTVIRDCDFIGAASTWDADIRVGDCKKLVIDNCRFQHAVGTGGQQNIYINMVGTTGTGMVSNCTFSGTSETITAFATLKGTVLLSNCRGSKEIIDT